MPNSNICVSEKVNILADHFSKTFSSNQEIISTKPEHFNYYKTKKFNQEIDALELDNVIKNLNNKNSCGFDQISNKIIKLSTPELKRGLKLNVDKSNYLVQARNYQRPSHYFSSKLKIQINHQPIQEKLNPTMKKKLYYLFQI
ncbi:hypothetical protein BpHYR1_002798 [Brachionus plicatilis]|uniref:Uncharacterized protein n=1 Tax=Brachionus plicatilis TaxID=10195 RepID=A0A3M7P8R7_BRAPC|nr:hypothetical protein BpHYR1_002798 [Brachionus plicatilis]